MLLGSDCALERDWGIKAESEGDAHVFKDVDSAKQRILLIYLLVSLGLAYYFKDEIEETLKEGMEKIDEMVAMEDDLYGFHNILGFQYIRSQHISSDK